MPENELRTRAKDHLPTVLLTMLSIVQALALQILWTHIGEHDYLYTFSYVALISWLQIGATLLGVLLIWLIYTGLVMRFRWVPTTSDSVFPFVVGIIEFTHISALGPQLLGQWFLILAVIFGAMAWASHVTLRRARLDGENDAYFTSIMPAVLKDYTSVLVTMVGLATAGVYLWTSKDQGWIALLALVGATTALAYQMYATDVFWRRSVIASSDG